MSAPGGLPAGRAASGPDRPAPDRTDLDSHDVDPPDFDLGADRLAGRGDELYAALLAAHHGLDAAASVALNARLVLILANLAGDVDAVLAAIRRGRSGG